MRRQGRGPATVPWRWWFRTFQLGCLVVTVAWLAACRDAELADADTNDAPDTHRADTAITDVTVIDAASGVREHQTVVFREDEIVAVLPVAQQPKVATTIDGAGKYLIPGLWDAHVHLTYDERFTDVMPSLFLSYGITSVRDTGGLVARIQPVVEGMRDQDARAPRVFYAGPLLDGEAVVYDGDSRPEIGVSNPTAEAAVARVRSLANTGVDFIKIYELVAPEVFEALVETARSLDLPVASHVPLSMLASEAGPAVDSMEHLRNVELDCAAGAKNLHRARREAIVAHPSTDESGFELRSRLHSLQRLPAIADYHEDRCTRTIATLTSTLQVPTLRLNTQAMYVPFERSDWQEALERLSADAREDWQAAAERWRASRAAGQDAAPDSAFARWSLDLVGRMHQQGVPIGAGTDTPIGYAIPGYSLHTELERLVEAGLSPLDALASATIRPAEFFGLSEQMGSITPGHKADLVLLDADPLAAISNTRSIAAVVSKGVLVWPER